jgi:hypothetical protein
MEPKKEILSDQERRLLKGLEEHPELMERFLSILALAREPDATGRVRTADEVEALLVEQVRQLGRESLEGWARRAEERVAQQSRAEDPQLQQREKKRCAGGASSARSK